MSQRISDCFLSAKTAGRKVLIPFMTAGDPDPDWTVAVMHALVDAGADLIELGVPFSDPMADGTVIQLASERAIEKQVSLTGVLKMVEDFRQTDNRTPVVLMGYMNPVEHFGHVFLPGQQQQVLMVCCWWIVRRKNAMTLVLRCRRQASTGFA